MYKFKYIYKIQKKNTKRKLIINKRETKNYWPKVKVKSNGDSKNKKTIIKNFYWKKGKSKN